MYFRRIGKLKAVMAERPLSEREALPYVVVFAGLSSAVSYGPPAITNIWDWLAAGWSVAFAILGTVYIYRRNGGADGRNFLQRYIAILYWRTGHHVGEVANKARGLG